jgi:PAP_fibrillin
MTARKSLCRPNGVCNCLRRRVSAAAALAAPAQAADLKARLGQRLEGVNRGIFGVKSAHQEEIHSLVTELEALNPLKAPARHLEHVDGDWRLLYSSIRILGTRRSKLGLREFVSIGDMIQGVDVASQMATNRVDFNITGLGFLSGALTIRASYEPQGDARVAVTFQDASLEPSQLQQLFEQHYDMLLGIFNPDGWLDITYVDEEIRIGRDDKGDVFVLERMRDA